MMMLAPDPPSNCGSLRGRVKDAFGAASRSASPILDPAAPLPGLTANGSRPEISECKACPESVPQPPTRASSHCTPPQLRDLLRGLHVVAPSIQA
jgi:hypothetical protein